MHCPWSARWPNCANTMPLLDLIAAGGCRILRWEEWNAPAGRYFFSYRARADCRWLMGHAVVDEFATVSAPLFFSSPALLGRIYNAGLSLGHRRDPELALDQGWPPLCVGIQGFDTGGQADPEPEIMTELMRPMTFTTPPPAQAVRYHAQSMQDHLLELWRFSADVSCFATNAPLLPRQLRRLCDTGDAPLVLALSLGNRLPRLRKGALGNVQSVSESSLGELLMLAHELKHSP